MVLSSGLLCVDIVLSLAIYFAYIYIHMFNVILLYCYLIHDLIVNFLMPLCVTIYFVYRLSIITGNFDGLRSFFT